MAQNLNAIHIIALCPTSSLPLLQHFIDCKVLKLPALYERHSLNSRIELAELKHCIIEYDIQVTMSANYIQKILISLKTQHSFICVNIFNGR